MKAVNITRLSKYEAWQAKNIILTFKMEKNTNMNYSNYCYSNFVNQLRLGNWWENTITFYCLVDDKY